MTTKTADCTFCSKGLRSLGRESGFWTGEESEERELEDLGGGIGQHHSSSKILSVAFSRVHTALQATEIGYFISTQN